MERPANRLGNNIRVRMEEMSLTVWGLANRTGHSAATIERYLNGDRVPKATALWKLAKALDCTMEDLMQGVMTD